MIHQFIFAGPRPGLPAAAFQSYWVHFHAVDYASKIKQIRQYLVATREPVGAPGAVPFFQGVAEIWLGSEAEQIASLQSPEFLDGARRDEPRWAAFWQTLGLDTDPEVVVGDLEESGGQLEGLKLYFLLKRAPGLDRQEFRRLLRADHEAAAARISGLRRSLIGFCRDGLYGLGEPRFDAVEVWSFPDDAIGWAALAGHAAGRLPALPGTVADTRCRFSFSGREHWIIRPGERAPA